VGRTAEGTENRGREGKGEGMGGGIYGCLNKCGEINPRGGEVEVRQLETSWRRGVTWWNR
jgi:hypothetical protein